MTPIFLILQSIYLQFDNFCSTQVGEGTDSFFEACKLDGQFLQSALTPFVFVSGGLLPVVFWGVVILVSYLRYHNALLSAMIGLPILLTSAIILPEAAVPYVFLMVATGVACAIFILIWKIPRD